MHLYFKLLTQAIRRRIPPLYATDGQGLDALARVKFFMPDGRWTWYAAEGSPIDAEGNHDSDQPEVDFIFFGLVIGIDLDVGYFALSELEATRGPWRLPVERDFYFEPQSLRQLMEHYQREGFAA